MPATYFLKFRRQSLDIRAMGHARSSQRQQVHCPCGQNHAEGLLVNCSNCNLWLHGHCVGFAEATADLGNKFYCQNCRTYKAGALRCALKTVDTQTEPLICDEKHVATKAIQTELGVCQWNECNKAARELSRFCSDDCAYSANFVHMLVKLPNSNSMICSTNNNNISEAESVTLPVQPLPSETAVEPRPITSGINLEDRVRVPSPLREVVGVPSETAVEPRPITSGMNLKERVQFIGLLKKQAKSVFERKTPALRHVRSQIRRNSVLYGLGPLETETSQVNSQPGVSIGNTVPTLSLARGEHSIMPQQKRLRNRRLSLPAHATRYELLSHRAVPQSQAPQNVAASQADNNSTAQAENLQLAEAENGCRPGILPHARTAHVYRRVRRSSTVLPMATRRS